MKSNHASLVLGQHKKGMIMVPKYFDLFDVVKLVSGCVTRPSCVICEFRPVALLARGE